MLGHGEGYVNGGCGRDDASAGDGDAVALPDSYRDGFRNSFRPSCHAANCTLMSSCATASVL